MSGVEALIDVNYIDHQGLGGIKLSGPAGFRQVVAAARGATSSLQVAIQDLVTEDDRMVARLRWYVAASDQPYERESIDILRIVDGRLVEHWGAAAEVPQEAGRGPTSVVPGTPGRLMNPDGVRAAYDAWAATYDGDRNLTPFTTPIIRSQLVRLSGASVVEIGCGTGANTVWLADAADRVIAFDFSARMLDQARQRVASDRVRFVQHDVSEPWPIPDQSADLVLDSLVLEHVADLEGVFREAHRVLKLGGSILVFELHPFKQMAGGQAHFVDRSTGKEVWVPAVRHDVSEYVNSGLTAGLSLVSLAEWRGSKATGNTTPTLLSLAFQKPASSGVTGTIEPWTSS